MYLCNIIILLYFIESLVGFYTNNIIMRPHIKLYMRKTKTSPQVLYIPKSPNQKNLVKYLDDESAKIIISLGPAGTGKTLFSCQKAITELKNENINKIIITRPAVTVEEEIGFLPGNIVKKMDPWTKPIFDIFLEYYSKTELDLMINSGKIEICPLAFMRGRTFKNSFILADEMQNSSPVQMKMLSTRIGINSRLIITGDLNQSDIFKENGLYDFVSKVERHNETNLIKIVRFDNTDVERSEIVKKVIEIYNYVKPVIKPAPMEMNLTKVENVLIKNVTTIEPLFLLKNETLVKNETKTITKNNDAALIPKHHISRNFDIFIQEIDF